MLRQKGRWRFMNVINPKRVVQLAINRLGYRLVPRNRDAFTFRDFLRTLPIRTIIDIGANKGATCAEWLTQYPAAQVHAVEALSRFQADLNAVAAISEGRMRVWQCAASDEAGVVTFLEHADHPSSSSLLKSSSESHKLMPFTKLELEHQVEAIPIDTLFAREGIDLPNGLLMKLDVQGAEAKVLRGARQTLQKTVAVLIEVNLLPLYEGQASFEELSAILGDSGLKFSGMLEQFHGNNGRPIYFDAVFLR